MTLRYLLDTDVISAPVAKSPNPRLVRTLDRHAHVCAIGAPVWHELLFGVRRLPAGKRRTALTAYVEHVVGVGFPILPYDEAAAAWHARERARLERSGNLASYVDGQIAAIAATNDLILVTRNRQHFTKFHGLEIEDWFKRSGRRSP